MQTANGTNTDEQYVDLLVIMVVITTVLLIAAMVL
jgi:hypothetical protein